MEWKKTKLVRWIAGPFTITEETTGSDRPYRLDGPDDHPQHFETLTEAKAHAATLNELALHCAEVARLRAELEELRRPDKWPTPSDDDDARAAQTFDGIADGEDEDDGRGIPRSNGHAVTLKF